MTFADARGWTTLANGDGLPAYRRSGSHPTYGTGTWSIGMYGGSHCFGVAFQPTGGTFKCYRDVYGSVEPFDDAGDAANFTMAVEAGLATWRE